MPITLALAAAVALHASQPAVAPAARAKADSAAPVAVVELFTSEGCSSCPPADRLLSRLVEEAGRDHSRIYPIAFHVDYWDNLGWKDPFAAPAYTQRQRGYAAAFPAAGVYTPQMLVNGRDPFVGSDEDAARRAITLALKVPAAAVIEVSATTVPGSRRAHVTGTVSQSAPADPTAKGTEWGECELVIILVERGLETTVKRGENAGRTLRHDNVARGLVTRPLSGATPKIECDMPIPDDAPLDRYSIIAFTQSRRTREITGASQATVRVEQRRTGEK